MKCGPVPFCPGRETGLLVAISPLQPLTSACSLGSRQGWKDMGQGCPTVMEGGRRDFVLADVESGGSTQTSARSKPHRYPQTGMSNDEAESDEPIL
jgi:hypothetical protein